MVSSSFLRTWPLAMARSQTPARATADPAPSDHHCGRARSRNNAANRNPNGTRTLKTTVKEHVLAKRRRYEQTEEFRRRYAERAGIEATNSELKRAHGLGRLRVRGGARVKLAVYLKALACNVKRMVRYLAEQARNALKGAVAGQDSAAAGLLGRDWLPYAVPRTMRIEPVVCLTARAA